MSGTPSVSITKFDKTYWDWALTSYKARGSIKNVTRIFTRINSRENTAILIYFFYHIKIGAFDEF